MVTEQVHIPVSPNQKRLFEVALDRLYREKGGVFRGKRMAKRDALEILCRRYLQQGMRGVEEVMADLESVDRELDSLGDIIRPIQARISALEERRSELEMELKEVEGRGDCDGE